MLTDTACKRATCPADKPRARLADAGGLYLEVAPNGSKRWFWKYYFGGKEKRLALGAYPDVPLKTARVDRDSARKLHQQGIDPAQKRQVDKLTRKAGSDSSFEAVAREFHKTKKSSWSPKYAARWMSIMEKDAFPWLGALPLATIAAPMLLQVLRRIEGRGAHETAHTLRQWTGQVFRHGIATGRCERNPAPHLQGQRHAAQGSRPSWRYLRDKRQCRRARRASDAPADCQRSVLGAAPRAEAWLISPTAVNITLDNAVTAGGGYFIIGFKVQGSNTGASQARSTPT